MVKLYGYCLLCLSAPLKSEEITLSSGEDTIFSPFLIFRLQIQGEQGTDTLYAPTGWFFLRCTQNGITLSSCVVPIDQKYFFFSTKKKHEKLPFNLLPLNLYDTPQPKPITHFPSSIQSEPIIHPYLHRTDREY